MSSSHPAFVSPAELEAVELTLGTRLVDVDERLAAARSSLEARALRAEAAILRLDDRVEALEGAVGALEARLEPLADIVGRTDEAHAVRLERLGADLRDELERLGGRVREAERAHRELEGDVRALERDRR